MARITHKVADAFIRKYNKHFAIKNYSKMKLDAKIKAIDSHTQRAGGQPAIRTNLVSTVRLDYMCRAG